MQSRSPLKALTLQNQDLTEENNVLNLKLRDAEQFIEFLHTKLERAQDMEICHEQAGTIVAPSKL